jgi:S-adenosylmethionine synthetase
MIKWTSEAVSKGHPDKVADQVADAVLDACLAGDPDSKVACEVTLTTGTAFITGEIDTESKFDIESVVRKAVCESGYDNDNTHFNGNTIEVINRVKKQSDQIQRAVFKEFGEIGAGDQGMMFGYATDETETYMPLTHHLSFEAVKLLELNPDKLFYPDSKTQVTVNYAKDSDGVYYPHSIDAILISTCHVEHISFSELEGAVVDSVLKPLRDKYPNLFKIDTKILINPAGLWTIGGPAADTGLSGRKIVVDNYGSDCPIGGGSFSGKDPTKVDRSAAYAARYIAKNVVAEKIAKKCRVQIAYAIGVVEPVSVCVETFGTLCDEFKDRYDADEFLSNAIQKCVLLSPKAIIDRFDLKTPIYKATAAGGHFGRDCFPWEKITNLNPNYPSLKDWLNLLNRVK